MRRRSSVTSQSLFINRVSIRKAKSLPEIGGLIRLDHPLGSECLRILWPTYIILRPGLCQPSMVSFVWILSLLQVSPVRTWQRLTGPYAKDLDSAFFAGVPSTPACPRMRMPTTTSHMSVEVIKCSWTVHTLVYRGTCMICGSTWTPFAMKGLDLRRVR